MQKIGRVKNWWYNRIVPTAVKEILERQHIIIEAYRVQAGDYRSEIQELTGENNMLITVNEELKRDLTNAHDLINNLRVENEELGWQLERLEEDAQQLEERITEMVEEQLTELEEQ